MSGKEEKLPQAGTADQLAKTKPSTKRKALEAHEDDTYEAVKPTRPRVDEPPIKPPSAGVGSGSSSEVKAPAPKKPSASPKKKAKSKPTKERVLTSGVGVFPSVITADEHAARGRLLLGIIAGLPQRTSDILLQCVDPLLLPVDPPAALARAWNA